jgi:hypothetical protein
MRMYYIYPENREKGHLMANPPKKKAPVDIELPDVRANSDQNIDSMMDPDFAGPTGRQVSAKGLSPEQLNPRANAERALGRNPSAPPRAANPKPQNSWYPGKFAKRFLVEKAVPRSQTTKAPPRQPISDDALKYILKNTLQDAHQNVITKYDASVTAYNNYLASKDNGNGPRTSIAQGSNRKREATSSQVELANRDPTAPESTTPTPRARK